jgi:hypothetical protein
MKSPPIHPHLCRMNPTHILHSNFFKIHFLIILPSTTWSCKWLPTKTLYSLLFPPMGATCLNHFIFLPLIYPVIIFEEFRLWRSSTCSFLQPSFNSFLLGRNIFLRFVKTLSVIQNTAVYNAGSHVVIRRDGQNRATPTSWGGNRVTWTRTLMDPHPIVI